MPWLPPLSQWVPQSGPSITQAAHAISERSESERAAFRFLLPRAMWLPNVAPDFREPLALTVWRLACQELAAPKSEALSREDRGALQDALAVGADRFGRVNAKIDTLAEFADDSRKPELLSLASFAFLAKNGAPSSVGPVSDVVPLLRASARQAIANASQKPSLLQRIPEKIARAIEGPSHLSLQEWRLKRAAAQQARKLAEGALAVAPKSHTRGKNSLE